MASDVVVPEVALALARRFEGLHLKRYLCPAGYWTIGYGHRCPADQSPITREEAERLLLVDMEAALAGALAYCPGLKSEPVERRAALADFVFNLGADRLKGSTLRKRVNERDWQAAARELRRWVYAKGKVLPGLVLRREAEVELLLRAEG